LKWTARHLISTPVKPSGFFFSYRYTPEHVRKVLGRCGLEVCDQWIAKSEEEGVFLVRRSGVSEERR